MVEIPQSMLSGAHICSETVVELSLDEESGTLSMRPIRPQYTLDEMLARCDDGAR